MAKKAKYDPIYAEMLIEHCKSGKPVNTFPATIEVSRATVYNWIERHDEFRLAHEMGKQHLLNRGIEMMELIALGKAEKGASFAATQFLCRAVYGLRDDLIPEVEDTKKDKKKEITLAYKLDDLKPDVELNESDVRQLDTDEGNSSEKQEQSEEGNKKT